MLEAGRLKREIRRELNLKPKMSLALPGVLDVLVDGKPIFSLETQRRLPRRGEIAELIKGIA